MSIVKDHFEAEAKEFDGIIIKLIPYYEQMVRALVDSIPFEKDAKISIIDLGCGTGTIAKKLSEKYPSSKIVCLDIASNMLEVTKHKLLNHKDIKFICGDFSNMEFDQKFDVVVSSLALHHIDGDDEKKKLYRKIYNSLNKNGVFYNADVVLASTDSNQEVNMKRWIEYMNKSVPMDEVLNKWIPVYKTEDRPSKLADQLKWLEDIGFHTVDVIWKYYNFSVYGGVR